jgi:peptidoglycan/xylan/chitin deacetylase (PgdA/CDA1 family)
MSRSWKPAPFITGSIALHAGALLTAAARPEWWPWLLAGVAANQGVLTGAGLWPRSTLLGPNLCRLPASAVAAGQVAITIDDGPDPEVTPRVLDMLDAAGVRASFFCIGRRAVEYPDLCRSIVTRGHRVENHGYAHANAFAAFGPGRMRADISAAQTVLTEITGQAPRFFRATAGLRNPFLDPVLTALDLQLATWTRRGFDTRCGDPAQVHARLTRQLAAGDILLLHDGNAARTPAGQPVILEVLPRLLDDLQAAGLHCVTLADACLEM